MKAARPLALVDACFLLRVALLCPVFDPAFQRAPASAVMAARAGGSFAEKRRRQLEGGAVGEDGCTHLKVVPPLPTLWTAVNSDARDGGVNRAAAV